MIQRIQSLYLLLTTILSVLFLSLPVLRFSDSAGINYVLNFNGLHRAVNSGNLERMEDFISLSILLVLIPFLAFFIVFLFKRRPIQLKMTGILMILLIVLITFLVICAYRISNKFNADIHPGLNMIIPFLMLISAFLAFKGIRKDEKLVKSYDRLR